MALVLVVVSCAPLYKNSGYFTAIRNRRLFKCTCHATCCYHYQIQLGLVVWYFS